MRRARMHLDEQQASEQGEAEQAEADARLLVAIPLDRITLNPFQSRQTFPLPELGGLALSLKEQGVLVPVCVRVDPADPTRYQLVYGERRWRAARMVGLPSIPAHVIACSDQQMIELSLTENLQRRDLEPLEEAHYLRGLLDLVDERTGKPRYSTRTLSKRLGKPRNYLQDRLRLLTMPADVPVVLHAQPAVSLRSLFEIAKLPSAQERAPLLQALREGSMSTEEVVEVVKRARVQPKAPAEPAQLVEHEDGSFAQHFAHAERLMEASLARLEKLVQQACQRQDARQCEQLRRHLQETRARVERLEALLALSECTGARVEQEETDGLSEALTTEQATACLQPLGRANNGPAPGRG